MANAVIIIINTTNRSLLLLLPLVVLTAIDDGTVRTEKWNTPFVQVRIVKQCRAVTQNMHRYLSSHKLLTKYSHNM